MKIFVVTEGDYSSYQILGVFSSIEKAREICPAADVDRIEEYELDSLDDDERFLETFTAWIDAKTGDLTEQSSRAELHPPNWSHVDIYNQDSVIVAESVISAAHALKLAIEHRQALLRQRD